MKGRVSNNNGRLRREAGIAIGPILFVIAILGVLAAAISASSGFFVSSTSSLRAKAMAQAIIQRATEIRDAAAKVRDKGYTDLDIYSCATPDCDIFAPEGGGLINVPFPQEAFQENANAQPFYSPKFRIQAYRVKGITPDDGWQIGFFLWGLSQDVCVQINNLLGLNHSLESANGPWSLWFDDNGTNILVQRFGYDLGSPFAVQKNAFCWYRNWNDDGNTYTFEYIP